MCETRGHFIHLWYANIFKKRRIIRDIVFKEGTHTRPVRVLMIYTYIYVYVTNNKKAMIQHRDEGEHIDQRRDVPRWKLISCNKCGVYFDNFLGFHCY